MCCYVIRFCGINSIRIVCCMQVVTLLQFSYMPDDTFKFSLLHGNEIFPSPDMAY